MFFTCITTIKDSIYLKQISAADAETALREAIASLPFDDSTGPFDAELDWLQGIADGRSKITMHPVGHCKNTWLWLEGAGYEPQYVTYVVQTDVS